MVAAIGAVAAVGSAAAGALSSSSAAGAASSSAQAASAQQQAQYEQNKQTLSPFVSLGADAASQLDDWNKNGFTAGEPDYLGIAAGNVPGTMTEAALQQTPGYQFNLDQGLKSTQSAAAARGLGVSGAALKGAATYATGLADSTYQNQFANQQTKYSDFVNLNSAQQGNATNLFNRLSGTASIGENAGAQTASAGTAAANASGNYLTSAGSAVAAGDTGEGNAIINALKSASNSYATQAGINAGIYKPGSNGAP